jgi:hypothetical protein
MLIALFATGGMPTHLRSDNAREFIASTIRRPAGLLSVESPCMAPGSSWENEVVEFLHDPLRDEFPNGGRFAVLGMFKL